MFILEIVILAALIALLALRVLQGYWYLAALLLALDFILLVLRFLKKKKRTAPLKHVDETFRMDGKEFERYIGSVYEAHGYKVRFTGNGADQGLDLIVKRGFFKTGIQAKCYGKVVSNKAVQEALAGKKYYRLKRCAVVTNSIFSPSAVKLAQKCRVKLIDRTALAAMVAKVNKTVD